MTVAGPDTQSEWRVPVPRAATWAHRVGDGLRHPLGVGGLVAAAGGYLAVVDPNQPGHYPGCPVRAVTGLYCPGCGGLRAMHDLARGQLEAALSSNLAVVLAVPAVIFLWAIWSRNRLLGRPAGVRVPGWVLCVIVLFLVAFGVLRNLSGMDWLAP